MATAVRQWQSEQPDDNFHLRLKEPESSDSEESFLFVQQTKWQRELLARYGKELCLLDATYRTSRYSLPLFFLVVPTNINYMVVASFIVEKENQQSISEALRVIRDWNEDWKPSYFLTDFAEEEISAIESTFNGM